MSGLQLTGNDAAATAGRRDAKLALVIPHADPLRSPAWGFAFHIGNRRRLAPAAMGYRAIPVMTAVAVVARRSPATRGA